MFKKIFILFTLMLAINIQARNTASQSIRIIIVRPNQINVTQNQSNPMENTVRWNTNDTQKKITVSITEAKAENARSIPVASDSQVSQVISSSVQKTDGIMKVDLTKEQIHSAAQVIYTLLDT